jgi:phospholipase D-like protein
VTATNIVTVGIIFYVLTCLAFIDIARKDFGSMVIKVLWGFVAFVPFVGVIVYVIFGYRMGKLPERANKA